MSTLDVALGIVLCRVRFFPTVEAWDQGFGYRARPTVEFASLTDAQKAFVLAYAERNNLPMNEGKHMRMRGKKDFLAWHTFVAPYSDLLTDKSGWERCGWLLDNPMPKVKDGWDAFLSWAESLDGLSKYITNQRKGE